MCVAGGRVDVPAMTRILQGRMKEQTTSHDELRDAFQVGTGTYSLLGAHNPDFTRSRLHYVPVVLGTKNVYVDTRHFRWCFTEIETFVI